MSNDKAGLTWAVLPGRWVEFAKSALALPTGAEGRRLRDSVADIIALQAVWFALREIDTLPPAERLLGLDRAQVLIDKHAGTLTSRWVDGAPLPALLTDLITDARRELILVQASQRRGFTLL